MSIDQRLMEEIERRVARGEWSSLSEFVENAVRYYIERHSDEDWKEYVEKEVAWSRRHAAQ